MKSNLLIRISFYMIPFWVFISCSDDEDAPIELTAPSNVRVFDIGNTNSSKDLRIFFDTNHSSDELSKVRVVISKSLANLTLDDVINLADDRFYTISFSDESTRFNLDKKISDSDGDEIVNDTDYKLYLLAIPAQEGAEEVLSEASDVFTLTDAELRDFYVSSNATHSVELFDGVTGEHIKSFVTAGLGGLAQTQEVIFLEDGSLLVTGLGSPVLKRYDGETGAYLGDFTSGYTLNKPTKTNIGPDGYLYVSQWDDNDNAIVRFDLSTGAFVDEVVPSLFQGMDQAWDSEGNFYAVSWGLGKLQKYNAAFELLDETTSNLTGPVNIWVDEDDLLHVIDWTEGSVKHFDTDLKYLRTYISGMTNTEGYLIDGDVVYLCDWKDSKIESYHVITGEFIKTVATSEAIQEANSITFGPDHRPE